MNQKIPFCNTMANYAADSFELLRNRDRMLQQWKFENQLRREDEKRRKEQFLLAVGNPPDFSESAGYADRNLL